MEKGSPCKSILLLCGDYMEDFEAMIPFQALQAFGISVHAACPGKKAGEFCRTSIHILSGNQNNFERIGHNFILNKTFDEIELSKYDGLVIPGGRAPEYLAVNDSVVNLVSKFSTFGKPLAAICHGPLVLAAADAIRSRKCTAFLDHMEDYQVTVPFHSLQALGCQVEATCPYKKAGETCLNVVHDFEEGSQTYSEKPGQHFTVTLDFDSLNELKFDALVIPGGRAAEVLALDERIIEFVKDFMGCNKPVASIGHGQQILAAAGVLKGRKCTAHPAVKLDVVMAGGTWLEPTPVDRSFVDGNLVTAATWSDHPQFISQLMALLGISVSFN
ncbi:protein DJ-1 homolog D-like [Carica papaya]|uniref:protein DJ-1 homolog D-like n=1 Tax=Carica papaya TaxID=3649 RepID=UPI000B8CF588|nr:protein DJ-1 homolog D-like [Carica papaya]